MSKKYNLVGINKKHYGDIMRITSQEKTMSSVGLGRIWDERKVKSFIKYNKIEQKESPSTRTNFYWAMQVTFPEINAVTKAIVGIVGIHIVSYTTDKSRNRFYVTVFVDENETGKGYGTTFLGGAITRFQKLRPNTPIYADIGIKNIGSQKLHTKLGFVPISKTHSIGRGKTKYQTYIHETHSLP